MPSQPMPCPALLWTWTWTSPPCLLQAQEKELAVGINIMQPDSAAAAGGSGSGPKSYVVGDGGASWRLKALRRAQEQAGKEGTDLGKVRGSSGGGGMLVWR
jgi:hypothetical protein